MAALKWQADGRHKRPSGRHRTLKRGKARFERRKARRDPSCMATYTRYWGYET